MAERPILFSDPMVRAILDGRKFQTRRVLTPLPFEDGEAISVGRYHPIVVRRGHEEPGDERFGAHTAEQSWPCPYGEPGDRLWVREAWCPGYDLTSARPDPIYRASRSEPSDGIRWRPSIHMPRWASRLTLEVTSVRVERVQSISEDDARAEGVGSNDCTPGCGCGGGHRAGFAALWDSINGERAGCAWRDDPWVWVVSFRRVTP